MSGKNDFIEGFRPLIWGLSVVLAVFVFAGCAKPGYRDGTYTARSSTDDDGAYGEVTLTIAGEKIVRCRFVTLQRDGTVKDEEYGKINGEISNQSFYDKAQLAVAAMEKYAGDLEKNGNFKDVAAVSGATIAYNQFREAVEEALEAAAK
jgi:major membrane immunogen (membrane-anchored lipoprotein)